MLNDSSAVHNLIVETVGGRLTTRVVLFVSEMRINVIEMGWNRMDVRAVDDDKIFSSWTKPSSHQLGG